MKKMRFNTWYMVGGSGARWIAAIGLIGMLFNSGPKPATAEQIAIVASITNTDANADAYNLLAYEAEELIDTATSLIGKGADSNTNSVHQKHQLIIHFHKRLGEYDQAFSRIFHFENERVVDLLTAINGMEEYYRVIAGDTEPIADQRYRLMDLITAVNAMMEYDDLFIGHIIPGMWLVLDSIRRDKRGRWLVLEPYPSLKVTESYKIRLKQALNVVQPTSLAGRAEALKSSLLKIQNDLNDDSFIAEQESRYGEKYIYQEHCFSFPIGFCAVPYLPYIPEIHPGQGPEGDGTYCEHEIVCEPYVSPNPNYFSHRDLRKNEIIHQVMQIQLYLYLLNLTRYALSLLEFSEWDSDPDPKKILRKPEFGLESHYNQILVLFDKRVP